MLVLLPHPFAMGLVLKKIVHRWGIAQGYFPYDENIDAKVSRNSLFPWSRDGECLASLQAV